MSGLRSWYTNAKVRSKILTGFAAVLFLLMTVAAVVLIQAAQVQSLSEESRVALDALRRTDQLEITMLNRIAALRDFAISGDEIALQRLTDSDEEFDELVQVLRDSLDSPEQLARLDQVETLAAEWATTSADPMIVLRQRVAQGLAPFDSLGAFFRTNARGDVDVLRSALDEMAQVQSGLATDAREERDDAISQIRVATIVGAILAALLSLILATWIAGSISDGLRRAVQLAGTVASGDLTSTLPVESRDEVGELIGTLNRMSDQLRSIVSNVTGATTQVATAAEEIAAASEQISSTADQQVRGTEDTSSSMEQIAAQISRVARSAESLATSVEQTSTSVTEMSNSIEETATSTDSLGASVEETSTTIEEMVASITQVGRHVEESNEIAKQAESDARSGGEAVESTVQGMRRIHHQMETLIGTVRELGSASQSIGRISDVIEGIADQTNLLALNAAIEAARAGEHGRGFSVVAQEIRRLAERSVESTREISVTVAAVVEDMQRVVQSSGEVAERTNEGIRLADSAGQALEKIITSSGRTRALMDEVSLATQQQIGAARQAQQSVQHIQRVAHEVRIATREQATGSRQIAEAVENMNERTREVFSATGEQKRGGEMVLEATQRINQGAVDTQEAIREMAQAAQDLASQAQRLNELMASFRV